MPRLKCLFVVALLLNVHMAAARETCADLWAIWNHIATRKRSGDLFPPQRTRELWLDPAIAVNQQGGACGWAIQVRVRLDGYQAV